MNAANVATVIADLRRTYDQLAASASTDTTKPREWSMRLTLEEVGALLGIYDECLELRRQTVGDWEPPFPSITASCHVVTRDPIDDLISGTRSTDGRRTEGSWCRYCSTRITRTVNPDGTRSAWAHDLPAEVTGHHPAEELGSPA